MAFVFPSAGALDYAMCSYGASRQLFRGPKRDTARAYVAVLGGSEVFGRFVPAPFPDLLERDLGLPVINLGIPNAGPDAFLQDKPILEMASRSSVCVVHIMGAQNLSNCFYQVHPRRNDRFLAASPALRSLYPKVDFTEFHFTRHLLQALHHHAQDRFELVAQELRSTWVLRTRQLLDAISAPKLLLWVADAAPEAGEDWRSALFSEPMLIQQTHIDSVATGASTTVQAIISAESRAIGVEGMHFEQTDLPHVAAHLGPLAQREIAVALLPAIESILAPGYHSGAV